MRTNDLPPVQFIANVSVSHYMITIVSSFDINDINGGGGGFK
jgi:hypothetical protein